MKEVQHNLPSPSSSFVGRENEIIEISELLWDPHCRLLTLVGPGGVGKTRLALEVARRFVDPEWGATTATIYPDGVYLVALQPVASPEDSVTTIAGAVGFEFHQARSAKSQLLRYLAEKRSLLILDNFEHLLPASELLTELLTAAPGVKLLVTSRIALNLALEWLYHVRGMAHPRHETFADLETYSAVKLFVERARQVRRAFSVQDEGAQVIQICQLLGGLPLGIELAASWLRRLPCREIATEIQRGLDILESDLTGLLDRHRSMRAVLNHSWKLLGQEEREALMKLSVFRGGFRREAAECVTGASLQTLSTLVDHSQLRLTSTGRYEIHELQRQFAAEKLAEEPELESAVRDRHCDCFADLMDQPPIKLFGERGRETAKALEADIDNLRQAWSWAVAQNRIRNLHQCMETMYWLSWLHAWPHEVEQAFQGAEGALRKVELGPIRDIILGRALYFLGRLDDLEGRTMQAQEKFQESLALLRRHDARRELAQAMMFSAIAAVNASVSPEEAQALALEALALLEETGQDEYLGEVYHYLGYLALRRGLYPESEQWYQKALQLGRTIADQKAISLNLVSLAGHAHWIGVYGAAEQFLREGLAIAREHKLGSGIVLPLVVSGMVAEATGRFAEAETHLNEALEIARESGQGVRIAMSLIWLAHATAARGEDESAARMYREALDTLPHGGGHDMRLRALAGLGRTAYRVEKYGQAREYHSESLDLSRQLHERWYVSHNLSRLGRIALAEGDHAVAGQHLRAGLEEALAIDAPPLILDSLSFAGDLISQAGDPALATWLVSLVLNHPASHARTKKRATRLLERLEAGLPADTFASTYERGALDPLEQTAAIAVEQLACMIGQAAPAAPSSSPRTHLEPLTERELEVLRLVALGNSNREIADELFLALGTVKSHLHNIFQKLGVSSRMKAVARCRELRLL